MKWSQHDAKMDPKSIQNRCQNDAKMEPKWLQNGAKIDATFDVVKMIEKSDSRDLFRGAHFRPKTVKNGIEKNIKNQRRKSTENEHQKVGKRSQNGSQNP